MHLNVQLKGIPGSSALRQNRTWEPCASPHPWRPVSATKLSHSRNVHACLNRKGDQRSFLRCWQGRDQDFQLCGPPDPTFKTLGRFGWLNSNPQPVLTKVWQIYGIILCFYYCFLFTYFSTQLSNALSWSYFIFFSLCWNPSYLLILM